jgi:curli biogenesis system outer membrane secretion channel CsgG
MKKTIMVLSGLCLLHSAFGQDDEKVRMEKVKSQCASLPLEQRARLSVTKFSITTSANSNPATATVATPAPAAPAPHGLFALAMAAAKGAGGATAAPAPAQSPGYIPPALGDNLTTMLTDALYNVNCFRVLESLKNNADLTVEMDEANSIYASKKGPKAGKQLGAQIVVTGEIIEYSIDDKKKHGVFSDKDKKTVKLGFNLKMINPETRDIIASQVFNVETNTTSKTSNVLGFKVGTEKDPAVAAVMQSGVLRAVEFLSKMRDSLHITADGNFAGNDQASNGLNSTDIVLSNANYGSFTAFTKILSGLPEYKSMDKSLSNGVATFSVSHTGKSDALLDELNKIIDPAKFEVTGFDAGKIEIKAK